MNAHHQSGAGWTVELVKQAIERGAKLERFNAAYVKLYMKRPAVKPVQFMDFGLPEFGQASLVPMAVVKAAVPDADFALATEPKQEYRGRPKP